MHSLMYCCQQQFKSINLIFTVVASLSIQHSTSLNSAWLNIFKVKTFNATTGLGYLLVYQKMVFYHQYILFLHGEKLLLLQMMRIVFQSYSVLGSPVSRSAENREWEEIKEKLMNNRKETVRIIARKACQHTWMKMLVKFHSQTNFLNSNFGQYIFLKKLINSWIFFFLSQN